MVPKTSFFHFQTRGPARVTIPPDNGAMSAVLCCRHREGHPHQPHGGKGCGGRLRVPSRRASTISLGTYTRASKPPGFTNGAAGRGLIWLILEHPCEPVTYTGEEASSGQQQHPLQYRSGRGSSYLMGEAPKIKSSYDHNHLSKETSQNDLILTLTSAFRLKRQELAYFAFLCILAMTSLSLGQHPKAVNVPSLNFQFLIHKAGIKTLTSQSLKRFI